MRYALVVALFCALGSPAAARGLAVCNQHLRTAQAGARALQQFGIRRAAGRHQLDRAADPAQGQGAAHALHIKRHSRLHQRAPPSGARPAASRASPARARPNGLPARMPAPPIGFTLWLTIVRQPEPLGPSTPDRAQCIPPGPALAPDIARSNPARPASPRRRPAAPGEWAGVSRPCVKRTHAPGIACVESDIAWKLSGPLDGGACTARRAAQQPSL
jgi:hypothetical protein